MCTCYFVKVAAQLSSQNFPMERRDPVLSFSMMWTYSSDDDKYFVVNGDAESVGCTHVVSIGCCDDRIVGGWYEIFTEMSMLCGDIVASGACICYGLMV